MSQQSRWLKGLASPGDLLVATAVGVGVALSLAALMVVAHVTHLSPLPAPLGVAFAKIVLPSGSLGDHGLLWVGLGLHVVYVTSTTVAYVVVLRSRLGGLAAFAWAPGLWVFAGVVFAPLVGWGLFASGTGAGGFVHLLAVHLAYGAFLWAGGWVAFRETTPAATQLVPSSATLGVGGRA